MSEEIGPQPSDPLTALRNADHRPLSVRLVERLRQNITPPALRAAMVSVAAIAGVALVWQAYVATDPPIEDSLPLARATVPTNAEFAGPPSGEISSTTIGVAVAVEELVPDEDKATEIIIHVAGAVSDPGLVDGEEGWRVYDAMVAAGGALIDADLDRLNLAATIGDGERLFVPFVGEDPPSLLAPTGRAGPASTSGSAADVGPPIDINLADEQELEELPGVGPVTAAAIVQHRLDHGRFASVDALVAVRGIGPATVENLRGRASAG